MISSNLVQEIPEFDEVITPDHSDFEESGLKVASLIRIGRIAVVDGDILLGKLGQVNTQRLLRIDISSLAGYRAHNNTADNPFPLPPCHLRMNYPWNP
jgi:hypothetical protein